MFPVNLVHIMSTRASDGMSVMDHACQSIPVSLGADISKEEKSSIESQLRVREEQLAPIYHQIAVSFADLHDTPGRMQEKGVVAVSEVTCYKDSDD